MKRWEILNSEKREAESVKIEEVIDILLENRGIGKEEQEQFIIPQLEDVTPKSVGIDLKQLEKALKRISKAIDKKEKIIVFGDYDVDGITGSAILWETLHNLGANALPYIPHRIGEGYGLSLKGIQNLLETHSKKCHPELVSGSNEEHEMLKRVQHDKVCTCVKLIITVDNGIVANEAVDFANQQGIDVIITDHHTVGEKLPDAHAVVHTTKLCGAGVALLLSKEITPSNSPLSGGGQVNSSPDKGRPGGVFEDKHLELAALGTVADLVPLTGANRTIVKYGLEKLVKTKRPGLLHMFKEAKLQKNVFTTYDVGFIIAPRLNAAGRIESAMDSLRLLCTNSFDRAEMLAEQLELTNKERQLIMKASAEHAILGVRGKGQGASKLLFVAHETYPQGVIGLVAGRLVEEFYRPSIVISIGETHSKASVRSVSGFNIIDFLRRSFDDFVNIGGHPMAAGFTVETNKLQRLQERLEQLAEQAVDEGMLTRTLKIDCELPLSIITHELYNSIQQLAPFGMANQEPTFISRGVIVKDMRLLGAEKNHLKLVLAQRHSGKRSASRISHRSDESDSGQARMTESVEAIAFKMGEFAQQINIGDAVDLVYTVDTNTWNGKTTLQLKVKDIRLS